ncbi:hypothetical protein D3C71_1437890 [compost metagenome]
MPLGRRPVCAAVCCCAPLLANHAGLKACCALTPAATPPAINNTAMACDSARTCGTCGGLLPIEPLCCFTIAVTRRNIVR